MASPYGPIVTNEGLLWRWVDYHLKATPDIARQNPFAVQALGCLFLNCLFNVCIASHPHPVPASMYVMLVGPTNVGKGTLLDSLEYWVKYVNEYWARKVEGGRLIGVLKNATASGIRDALATRRWVKGKGKGRWVEQGPQGPHVIIWPRLIPTKWQLTLVEVLEEAYYARGLGQERITTGARVAVDPYTYTLYAVFDVHPEHYAEVMRRLQGQWGFRRRLLTIAMRGELPEESPTPPPDAEEELARALETLVELPGRGITFTVDLRGLDPVWDEVRRWGLPREERFMVVDYVKRLTAATVVDELLARALAGLAEVSTSANLTISELTEKLVALAKGNNLPALVRPSFSSHVSDSKVSRALLTFANSDLLVSPREDDTLIEVASTWAHLIRENMFTPRLESPEVAEWALKLDELFSSRGPVVTKKEVWLKVFGGHGSAREVEDRLKALEEQGLIVVRQVGAKHTYVLAPDFRSCGTCRKFYFCDKVRNISRRERLERPACDEYEPEVEGHA